MAELLQKLQDLLQLPLDLHWFCDLGSAEDCPPDRQLPIALDLRLRQDEALECLLLYTYSDAKLYQERLESAIGVQLGRCDVCIEEYYKARAKQDEKLRNEFPENEADEAKNVIDKRDFERINRGLDDMRGLLENLEPSQRNKDAVQVNAQLALFEALCNEQYLLDVSTMTEHFDAPFALVQTNRKLNIARYVPAATAFLFQADQLRYEWARRIWFKQKTSPSRESFEFAIKGPLLRQMQKTFTVNLDDSLLHQTWEGLSIIVQNLNNDLVTHSLRALDIDVFKMALDHLRFPLPALRPLIETIQLLLEIAPKDFWDSMGAISPTIFVEQIFNNSQYDRYLLTSTPSDREEASPLADMLSWIKPFISSLEIAHQAGVCRSLSFQLLQRLQAERFPECARIECYRTGMAALAWTLHGLTQGDDYSATGQIVAKDVLDVVGDHMQDFAKISSLPTGLLKETCEALSLRIVQDSLALECKSFRTDKESVKRTASSHDLPAGFGTFVRSIWDGIISNLAHGGLALVETVLVGVGDLTGFETISVTAGDVAVSGKSGLNTKLGRLTDLVSQILKGISDYNSTDLEKLYKSPQSAKVLISTLFSDNPALFDAGVRLVKAVSGEPIRREAIGKLLKSFTVTSMNALSSTIHQIACNKLYAPCSRMFKSSSDVVDTLCNAENGLLRTRSIVDIDHIKAVRRFWQCQWRALKTIYEMTEAWSRAKVDDVHTLKEFCRDTMQFSDHLFDQYSLFASVSQNFNELQAEAIKGVDPDADENMLEYPAMAMQLIVKWLRLRDVFLVGLAVKLTQKILAQLTQHKQMVDDCTSQMLEQIIVGRAAGRSHLTPQEKAEILSALEANLGRSIIQSAEPDDRVSSDHSGRSTPHAQQNITKTKARPIDLAAWTALAKTNPGKPSNETSKPLDFADQEADRSAQLIRRFQDQQAARYTGDRAASHQKKAGEVTSLGKSAPRVSKQMPSEAEQTAFVQKRRQDQEAQKRRNAENLAMMKRKTAPGAHVPGQGSAISGLGVSGKVHAPQGPSMMLSSESESDGDDESDDDIIGIARPIKTSAAVHEFERNRKHAMNVPVKKRKQARSAKDMRARLTPDLTSLHRTLLLWDYFHEGDFPPKSSRQDYRLVSNTFKTPSEYQSTFEPLLMLEAWQQVIRAREENTHKAFEVKVSSRITIDSFLETSTTMPLSEANDISIGEGDIVLMSTSKTPTRAPLEPHCCARIWKISRRKGNVQVTYRANASNPLLGSMVPNVSLHCVKLFSITPLEREYGALRGLQYFDLCDEVIRAKPSSLLEYSNSKMEKIQENYAINLAQARAVRSAIDNDAFTLIQGPPGSGKTKTIVAIVGALLTESLTSLPQTQSIQRPRTQGNVNPSSSVPKKLLVCAPSNAAVDELVMRFKQGIRTKAGEHRSVSVVRLGRSDAINANVMDVTLEELVNAKLNIIGAKTPKPGEELGALMTAHKSTCEDVKNLRATFDAIRAADQTVSAQQSRDMEVLKRKLDQLSRQIDAARDNGDMHARNAEINRRQAQQEILDGAHVICATLSGSGHDMFQNLNIEFETVIIDEAAQCIELSALIPLKYGCSKCVLVGDPKQLPPTVLSREAARFQYEQSLFVRMQENHPESVHLLDTQYRMHPEISRFPSTTFYDGRLVDGPQMARQQAKAWHERSLLGPYRFFDVQGVHQSAPHGHSLINLAEVDFALKLYHCLVTGYRNYDFKGKIGIITPYKSQLRELRSRFARRYGDDVLTAVEFNTTDAFQGRESEVIIFSCVRASVNKGIGFLSDVRRMNVGITRAKSSLWVLGNSSSLMQGEFWRLLIEDARKRNLYSSGNISNLLQHSELTASTQPTVASQTPVPPSSKMSSVMGHANSSALPSTSRGPFLAKDALDASSQPAVPDTQTKVTDKMQQTASDRIKDVEYIHSKPPQQATNEGIVSSKNLKKRKLDALSPSNASEAPYTNGARESDADPRTSEANGFAAHPSPKLDELSIRLLSAEAGDATTKEASLKSEINRPMNDKPPRIKKKAVDPFIRRKK